MIRRIASGVGANVFDKLMISASQLIMVPVFASLWGLHLFGLWTLLITVPSFLAMGDLGFATAAGVKMTIANARGERAAAIVTFQSAWGAILSCTAVLVVVAGLVAAFVPVGLFGATPGIAPGALRVTLLLVMLYGITVLQQSIFFAGLRCDGFFAVGAASHGCIVALESTLAIGGALAGGSLPAAAAGMFAGRLIGVTCVALVMRRKVPWLPIGLAHARRDEVRALLRPATGVMLLPIANAIYLQGSAIALGAAAGAAAVPAFTATRTLSRLGLQACLMINTALMPEFSRAVARDDRRGMAVMVAATIALSLAIVIPVVLGLGVTGRTVVQLWTRGVIDPPVPLLLAVAASTLAIGLWYPLSNLLLAMNRHGGYALIFALLSVGGVPLTYALVHAWGVAGAGVTMLLIDLAMVAVIAYFVRARMLAPHEIWQAAHEAVRRVRALPGSLKRLRRG